MRFRKFLGGQCVLAPSAFQRKYDYLDSAEGAFEAFQLIFVFRLVADQVSPA